MNLSNDHDRKGMVATILIHSIIFLLMLIWVMGEAKDMEEPDSGVQVSFGDPDAGGPQDISQAASAESTPTPPSNPTQQSSQNNDPVVTNDDADQPAMNNTTKSTPKTENTEPVKEPVNEPTKQEPTISEAKKALERWKKTNSETTTSTGPGTKKGPKGQPNETEKGPGGKSQGTDGNINYNLDGFGISKNPNIVNQSQDDGSVKVSFCVDKSGNLIESSLRITGGTATSTYLRDLSKNAIKRFEFYPFGDQAATNCGTITFNYGLH